MPELVLGDDESEKLGDSIERVLALYSMDVNPATLAWMSLITTLVVIYGPRWYAIAQRLKEERAKKPAPAKVTPFPSGPQRAAAGAAAQPEPSQAPPPPHDGPTGTPQDYYGIGYSAAIPDEA